MKSWLFVALAGILGMAAGIAGAVARVHHRPWDGTPNGPDAVVVGEPPAGGPRISVPQETYEFGLMDINSKQSHSFVVTNIGKARLTLEKGDTSCKCTVSDLDKAELLPGEATKVTLEWAAKGKVNGPFRQHATILTNDPLRRRVIFTVTGRVVTSVDVSPQEVVFSGIAAGETADHTVRLFSSRTEPVKIEQIALSDPATANRFEVQYEPLAAKDLKDEPDAKSGYLLHVRVKPGLPPGTFQQTIQVKTNIPSSPTVSIPLRGSITSDISILGTGWDESTRTVWLGTTTPEEEIERSLTIVVRGKNCTEVKFAAVQVDPDLLKVELGPTLANQDGRMTRTALKIRVPRGSRAADYLGAEEGKTGRIVLATHHPRVPELQIRVRFAVQN